MIVLRTNLRALKRSVATISGYLCVEAKPCYLLRLSVSKASPDTHRPFAALHKFGKYRG
jgi:hypothetical protein